MKRPGAWLTVLITSGVACRVTAPPPPRPFPSRAPPPASSDRPLWYQAETDRRSGPRDVLVDRPAANARSPLGVEVAAPDQDPGYLVFTDRFQQAGPWRSEDWKGRPRDAALALDPSGGWPVRLQRDQVAVATVPVRPGERYVLDFQGDGRLDIEGAGELGRDSPSRMRFRADGGQIELRIERTSPSTPIRRIRILPARYADADRFPRFESALLERLERFAVLRFGAGWSRTGDGIDVRAFDLAEQVSAEPWFGFAVGFGEAREARLIAAARERLPARSRVWIEDRRGDEPERPSVLAQIEDRAASRAARARARFAGWVEALGVGRVVRVLSVAGEDPETARRMLADRSLTSHVDAVAVTVWAEQEAEGGISLERSLQDARSVLEQAEAAGLFVVAAPGGLRGFENAAPSERAVALSALLDRWRAMGGQLVVLDPLVGAGCPVPDLEAPLTDAPEYVTAQRFIANNPRWWERETPAVEVAEAPAPADATPLAVETEPAPPKLYTAPWVKWASLGVGVAAGLFATERMLSAQSAAGRRDDLVEQLNQATDAETYAQLQTDLRGAENDRELAQSLGFVGIGVASALVGWAIAQWLEEPPEPEIETPPWAEGYRR